MTPAKSLLSRRAVIAGTTAALLGSARHASAAMEERPDLATVFAEHGATGTFAMLDAASGKRVAVERARAELRMVPASTFKIANSLIALETRAVADENEVIPYGGRPQTFKQWERDMAMREAIAMSNVPIYQELARRVGLERYREWLRRLGYGNADPGSAVDRFWLDGPLAISAIEQAEFLARLAKAALPLSARSQAIVRDIIRIERKGDVTLFAKTGWCMSCTPQIGWWAGWVEKADRATAFALNIDIGKPDDAANRTVIAKAILNRLGVY